MRGKDSGMGDDGLASDDGGKSVVVGGEGLREVLSSRAEDSTLINSPYLAPLIDLRSANVRRTANANFLAATFSHVSAQLD